MAVANLPRVVAAVGRGRLRAVLSTIAHPFWNAEERRPRALVRIAMQTGTLAALSGGVGWAFKKAGDAKEHNLEAVFSEAPLFVLMALVWVFATWLASRFFDRRSLEDLGLRIDGRWWGDLVAGIAIGAVLMGGIYGAELAFGWARFGAVPETGVVPRLVYLPVALFAFLAVGIYEELLSRGYHLTNLAEGLRCRWISGPRAALAAAVISSCVFGIAHAWNPSATMASTGNIVAAGMMLAVGYLTTGRLGLSIGLHFSWNFCQNLFGMPVSGQTRFFYGAIVTRDATGPAWVTGGTFGPEAGMTGLAAMLVGLLLVLAYVRLRYGALRIDPSIAAPPPLVRAGAPRAALAERPA